MIANSIPFVVTKLRETFGMGQDKRDEYQGFLAGLLQVMTSKMTV
jgi:hypothetical protein